MRIQQNLLEALAYVNVFRVQLSSNIVVVISVNVFSTGPRN